MNPNKKISFSFNKSSKKPTVIHNKPTEHKQVELVDCLEERSIKIKDAVEVVKEPLVIPMKGKNKNLSDRTKEVKTKEKELIKNNSKQEDDSRPESELTIEELAARELINDAKRHVSNKVSTNKLFVLPIKEDKITLDGEAESTLDDYESVPISEYGMAMIRGMGWKEGMGIGKNPTKSAAPSEPELRPKGLGLGASKMVKAEISNETDCDKDGNPLILKKGAFGKIIAGSHKGNYCEVQGLDDESGRVIVRTSITGQILTLIESFIMLVTPEEFSKGSKVLNNAKYEEFKEISDKKLENYQKAKGDTKDRYSKKQTVTASSSRKVRESQGSQDNERSTKSRDYDAEYLNSKQENRRSSKKSDIYENERYEKINKDIYKYDGSSKSSHRNNKRDSSESDSDSEMKNRRDSGRKKYHHKENSRYREDEYNSEKKFSKSKYRSRSSSSDNDEKEMNKKNKTKARPQRHDSSERAKDWRSRR